MPYQIFGEIGTGNQKEIERFWLRLLLISEGKLFHVKTPLTARFPVYVVARQRIGLIVADVCAIDVRTEKRFIVGHIDIAGDYNPVSHDYLAKPIVSAVQGWLENFVPSASDLDKD